MAKPRKSKPTDEPHDDLYAIHPSRQVRTFKRGETIELRRRWIYPGAWTIIGAALFWNGAMVAVLWATVFSGEPFPLCVSLHLLVGVGFGYYALALLLNETRVYIEGTDLQVITTPVLMHPPRKFHAYDIARVSIEKSSSQINSKNLHDLLIHTNKGETHKVLGNLNRESDGLFLKQELEFILGIEPGNYQAMETKKGKRTP